MVTCYMYQRCHRLPYYKWFPTVAWQGGLLTLKRKERTGSKHGCVVGMWDIWSAGSPELQPSVWKLSQQIAWCVFWFQANRRYYYYSTCTHVHLKLIKFFLNSQTEHDMEMKFVSIDFSSRVVEGSRSSWLQIQGNQLIDCSPYIGYTNRK